MSVSTVALPPAAQAFDAIADAFDSRYGSWLSVAAQRRAVRRELARAFAPGARVLEVGGGTGEDALWLRHRGVDVLLTDPSPNMVHIARRKLGAQHAHMAAAEDLAGFAARWSAGRPLFAGAFSNFAALNCVADLGAVARGLARLLLPGAPVLLVLFGPLPPGEVAVQFLRRQPCAAFRRLGEGDVPARLGGRSFTVRYHRYRAIARALAPWFELRERRGIGIFVPPSAAEPWISSHPVLLRALEALDRRVSRPLALLGDHVLYHFVRTGVPSPAEGA